MNKLGPKKCMGRLYLFKLGILLKVHNYPTRLGVTSSTSREIEI